MATNNTHKIGNLEIEFEEHDFGNDMQFGSPKGRESNLKLYIG